MKSFYRVGLLLLVIGIVAAVPVQACDWYCGYDDYLGEALCLVLPTLDGYQNCFEVNFGQIHDCAVWDPCRNGYPIP